MLFRRAVLKVSMALLGLCVAACAEKAQVPILLGSGPKPLLPPPEKSMIPTVNIAPARGWLEGGKPVAATGLLVSAFATNLEHPRWLHVLPNGDVLVAETNAPPRPEDEKGIKSRVQNFFMKKAGAGVPSANRITLLRDTDGDGVADLRSIFLSELNSPFGMALVGDSFYVANTDALMKYPYAAGENKITAPGTRVAGLPGGALNHHWTKNLIASKDGSKLYVAVGSNSNVAENGIEAEKDRAAILEIDAASGTSRVYASGLRNPVGMAWHPDSGELWTAVNERDEIGSDLVPDYMTSVREGAFYGWPYSYYGGYVDERVQPQRPELVATATVPDYALGAHTASLGLAYAAHTSLPQAFSNGMFVGQHGSWNRKPHSGYKVIFVAFRDGKPTGEPVDVLSGFLNEDGEAQGRPVGVEIDRSGALLVADDVGNVVWRVIAQPAALSAQPAAPSAQAAPTKVAARDRVGGCQRTETSLVATTGDDAERRNTLMAYVADHFRYSRDAAPLSLAAGPSTLLR